MSFQQPARIPTLLIATTNPGKLREISRALEGLAVEIAALANVPRLPEPEETGLTFAENALLKANYYAAHMGWPTVADDSGLAIDALSGRPGVASARYPGDTYSEKFANLYRELAAHPRPWAARFVCSVAVVDVDHVLFTCEALVAGEIVPAPRGTQGFGYDPIFFYPPYGRTFGEVTEEEKMAVSHRGRAFAQLRHWLQTSS